MSIIFQRVVWSALRCTLSTALAACSVATAHAGELYVNTFRNPSMGLEYRSGFLSVHSGYYTTILRDHDGDRSRATGFLRTGVTAWYDDRWYASVSHLRGLDGARDGRDFLIAETGAQWIVFNHVALRVGVAVIPRAHGFKTRVNPTPGLSVRVPL